MADRFTEVTRTGWGKRIGQSLSGALIGGLLFLASFALLWWNEGRAIGEARALAEGAGAVIDVGIDAVEPKHEGKLLHVTGAVDARPEARDAATGIAVDALQLRRVVEMYQWVEKRSSKEEKKLGGGTETVTTYDYEQEWNDDPIDSSDFKRAESHANPGDWPLRSDSFAASEVTLGAFTLAQSVRDALGRWQDLPANITAQLPEQFGEFRRIASGLLYRGTDPERPQVGDMRVRYEYQPEATYSIIAKQSGGMLDRYVASNGRDVLLVEDGSVPAAKMFEGAQSRNSLITWLARAGGTLLMWIGLSMVFAPISRVLDVVPMLGTIGGWGIGVVTGLVALLLSLMTIGIAWVFYRPVLGGAIIVGVIALFFWSRSGRKPAPAAATPIAAPPSAPPPPPVA
ncbi:MAG TPA: TMEM43 family protein [Patescibacteria group bacterium]|nr:TMEM43 family protein [Patescibacteria group bacterium]